MSLLSKYFGVSAEATDTVGELAEKVSTTTEFLGDVAEKIPDAMDKIDGLTDQLPDLFVDLLERGAPWLTATGEALGEALPPLKAALSFLKFVTRENDPNMLGLLAVSVAYQASLADAARQIKSNPALRNLVKQGARPPKRLPRGTLGGAESVEAFAGFSFATALGHPLVLKADAALRRVAEAAGFPDNGVRLLIEGVHTRFCDKLRLTVTEGGAKEKFDPLFRLLNIGGAEFATHALLNRHMEYQIWRFTKAPALGGGSAMSLDTPLSDIFIPLDCGHLQWGEIRNPPPTASPRPTKLNVFNEAFGGREPVLGAVLSLIGNPQFRDAIIVQGVAGAGKSAFTLHLCKTLRELGLRPLRVRMRDLTLDPRISLMDDVAAALRVSCGDDDFDKTAGPRPASFFEASLQNILDEAVPFGEASICPYVLIFDGWDEISISASEGFRIRIEKTLNAVRQQLLSGRPHRVRVVLTGRPSDDVNEAKFLLDETPVLTIRPFTDPQLHDFVDGLLHARRAVTTDANFERGAERAQSLIEPVQGDARISEDDREVLRLPLLALLAVWLVLNDPDPPRDLVIGRASLYKRLVDLTTRYGGNLEQLPGAAPRVLGGDLRDLLQRTATAMTVRGVEHISYDELVLSLEAGGVEDPDVAVDRAASENVISKLMLSFFFNTGRREHGCEFSHKSFREYLFAEAIVAALKRNAALEGGDGPRSPYWAEFVEGDPRAVLAEELGAMLGSQWLKPEVWRHLDWLIAWEIECAAHEGAKTAEEPSMRLSDWEIIRDRLVALWDWWAEGVHMRPQPYREKGKRKVDFRPPLALRIVERIAPAEVPRGLLPEPVRLTSIDSHLGDALFRLNCAVHFQINKATGWLDRGGAQGRELAIQLWDGALRSEETKRRYQTKLETERGVWWAFAPGTPDGENEYFANFVARINAAGWYPAERFPFHVNMSGADFYNADLRGIVFERVVFDYVSLENANLIASGFGECDFGAALCSGVELSNAVFYDCLNLKMLDDDRGSRGAIFWAETIELDVNQQDFPQAFFVGRQTQNRLEPPPQPPAAK